MTRRYHDRILARFRGLFNRCRPWCFSIREKDVDVLNKENGGIAGVVHYGFHCFFGDDDVGFFEDWWVE